MRTLVISDLHLGSRRPVDILRRPEPLDELCAYLETIDRLVLLGDILEMRHGPAWEAMAAARPVMDQLLKRSVTELNRSAQAWWVETNEIDNFEFPSFNRFIN